ncbi:MAG: hypothetical protein CME38_02405 [Haliea sp.]|nr:hypothetical protein [Haliea sp.]|tara:strand:- start:3259 stop:3687 length:429 start_codon:yes stop_codon:yes gene_type:complete
MSEFSIDNFPTLTKRLGRAKTARIRYAQKGRYPKTTHRGGFINTVLEPMQGIEAGHGHPVEDVLYGLAHCRNDKRPIRSSNLIAVLQCMPIINTREICVMFDISERQAMKYKQIIKAALPFIEDTLYPRSNDHAQTETSQAA